MTQKTVDILALESILSFIVKSPESIEMTRKVDEMGVLLILKVDRSDMGIVIGRNGEMANAIKKYIKKVGQVNNMNIRLRIDEPQEGEGMEGGENEVVDEVKEKTSNKIIKETVNEGSNSDDSNDHDLEEFSLT
jgi:uncharacterized protein